MIEDTFLYCLLGILGLILFGLFAFLIASGVNEIVWWRTLSIEWKATLLRSSHNGSTLESSPVVVATGNGGGVGMTTTGHDEQFVTMWDCGKYGRVTVDDRTVFQYAKEKAILLIKVRGDEVRIVGIKA